MPISQPNVSDDFAYVEVVQQLADGNYEAFVYLISRDNLSAYDCSFGIFRTNDNNKDGIIFHNNTDNLMNIYCVGQSGMIWNIGWVIDGDLVDIFSGHIVSVRTYGNIRPQEPQYYDLISSVFVYGSDNVSNQLLNEIRILLENNSGSAGSIVGSIQSSTGEIIKNDSANTDKIIDNQNNLYDKEKDEITQSGNTSSESVEEIPNQSEGFLKSLSNLTSAMSYNGTVCKWQMPNVYIPSISNIVPRIDLIFEQDIDFGYWVEKIPSNILQLIRAICTLALIVYCFKELYNTISYVLTLKGGNN